MIELLQGAIRQYSWGSRTALAELTGRPAPTALPEAELWLGAHPSDPAWLVSEQGGRRSLLDQLRSDPVAQLGPATCSKFGTELPFLMKVIAADAPLSLQAHPDSAQARDGFDREDAAGLDIAAPDRNYRDPRHKPELVVALDRFDALAGFRPLGDTRRLIQAFGIEHFTTRHTLTAACPSQSLRSMFTAWMSAPPDIVDAMVTSVLTGARRYLDLRGTLFVPEARTILELGQRYPGDAGVLAALLLNRITLEPGDALFLPAGNLHAYLRGTAVEVMANSDNVLRGGLTPKHVDLAELQRVLDFAPIGEADLRPVIRRDGPRTDYIPPVDEFVVSAWTLDGSALGRPITLVGEDSAGPHIVLCTQGAVTIRDAHHEFALKRGDAAWVSAQDRPVRVTADVPSKLFGAGVRP